MGNVIGEGTAGRGNHASLRIPGVGPQQAFALVTDLDVLPRWNDAIVAVVQRPAELQPGATWKVQMRDGALRWVSRSEVRELDPVALRFVHRSGTDDGNPSYAEWRWTVQAEGDGCRLGVSWALVPRTRLRRLVLARYRGRRLRREVPRSLERIAALLTERAAAGTGVTTG